MAQQPHVPKFGNFESDNDVPYTAYFEKARKDKGNVVRMNPNDPEENPEAFAIPRKGNGGSSSGNDSFPAIPSNNGISDKSIPVEKQQRIHRRRNSRSIASESSDDKGSTDNFQNRNRGRSHRNKSTAESEYYVPPSPGPRHRNVGNPLDASYASASVPKFGAWDEKDPTSGDGFTVIFDKVKDEKQIAASKFPVVSPPVVTHTRACREKTNKVKSKRWCCLFPRERD